MDELLPRSGWDASRVWTEMMGRWRRGRIFRERQREKVQGRRGREGDSSGLAPGRLDTGVTNQWGESGRKSGRWQREEI